MGKQALTWAGAVVCSVLLVIAGGLIVGSAAVHRYLQSSSASVGHSGFWRTPVRTPTATATADPELMPAVDALGPLEGVTSVAVTGAAELYVTMRPDASAAQSAAVVSTAARLISDSDVDLQLRVPAAGGRASAVAEFSDLLKARSGSALNAQAVMAQTAQLVAAMLSAAEVDGVVGVQVQVPDSWDVTASDVAVQCSSNAAHELTAVRAVLDGTTLGAAAVHAWQ